MDGLKNQIENLKLEKKSLQKRVMEMEMASLQQQSRETTALKSQVEALEAELARVRSSSTVDLEEELKKVRKELKSKELDLYHAEYEKTKQIDSAKSKIRALEKDCANYAKKNNELKTEIRKLRTHDDEPTTEIMNSRQPRLVSVSLLSICYLNYLAVLYRL